MDTDPIAQFLLWQKEADAYDRTAAVLATCTRDNIPYARTILVKDVTADGFTFYTNMNSTKGKNLFDNPRAAIVFYWNERQVIGRGNVFLVDEKEADTSFAFRPRSSRAVTTISKQSQELTDETLFLNAVKKLENSSDPIGRPKHWVGFRLKPYAMEFFLAGKHRLNKRYLYLLQSDGKWKISRLYP
ncbi:pyridoxine/pyridoxamine 5'-phosphate oxidase [Neorickettsia sennetsu]|uniref:Pyridoxamine 5-phosphate oxidase n=1 Tax=Ehrlichia sennetsu (strain ATCC VR-367 / Miyayama) TaxID=222891 RepID=Q2GE36_EHRS3|nr:pyridoxal 5'-phosphate synthase [Neorickettsia sennetsu]ABD45877.1 putative pyridoxamine 5-phosphate oxidase [Neorickettsia sennetsu str. Miyayama]